MSKIPIGFDPNTIRVALDSHADEARAVIEQAKKMLRLMWLSEVSAGAD